jgi:hypothetical protein
MFLRNKIAILSFTLMSLMTIPSLAENDNAPVNSRIESTNFNVEVKTPEGWSQTEDFKNVLPETFTVNGQTFRGLQFKNGTELHGCAVFFAEDSWIEEVEINDTDDANLINTLTEVQELAFPGSSMTKFTISKFTVDGSLAADMTKEIAKVNLKGIIEGSFSDETGNPSNLTVTGTLQSDSSKGNFAIGSGTFAAEGATPVCGTTGIVMGDDYQVIIAIWGSDEESQIRDTYRFLEAVTVTPKTDIVYAAASLVQDGPIIFRTYNTEAELDADRAAALGEWLSRKASDKAYNHK